MVATGLRGRWLTAPLLPSAATMFTLPPIQRLGEGDDSAEPGTAGPSPSPSRSSMLSKKSPKKARRRLRLKMGSRVRMMIVLLLFLQKQSLAFAVYLFGIGTLHTGPGLKKKHM